MDSGPDPITDDELLYRRIPERPGWYDPEEGTLSAEAFGPHKQSDPEGLSLSRAKYKSIQEAALGRGKTYYVAILRARDLRNEGIEVIADPQEDDPGHALLPGLNAGNRKADEALERKRILVKLCLKVEGPFSRDNP